MSDFGGYKATFRLGSFSTLPLATRCGLVTYLTRALATIDFLYLKSFPYTPSLYSSGVRYRYQKWGDDQWLDIPTMLAEGGGACEDLVAWRVAELTLAGENAQVDVKTQIDSKGRVVYHVLVLRADGTLEDPSKTLGMGSVLGPSSSKTATAALPSSMFGSPRTFAEWAALHHSLQHEYDADAA